MDKIVLLKQLGFSEEFIELISENELNSKNDNDSKSIKIPLIDNIISTDVFDCSELKILSSPKPAQEYYFLN